MVRGMTCTEAARILHDFVDGVLPLAERQRLTRHVRGCATCEAAIREIRCTTRLLGRLPREPMPDRMKAHLLRRFRQEAVNSPPGQTVRTIGTPSAPPVPTPPQAASPPSHPDESTP